MTSSPPAPDNMARRSADLDQLTDIFIGDDDEPCSDSQPAARPSEGPPCAP